MVSISFFNIPHQSYGRGGENWIKEVATSCGLPATLSTLPIFRELYNYNDAVMMCSGIECYIKSLLKLYESWKTRDYEELSKNSRELQ
jgi:hypothetical protein